MTGRSLLSEGRARILQGWALVSLFLFFDLAWVIVAGNHYGQRPPLDQLLRVSGISLLAAALITPFLALAAALVDVVLPARLGPGGGRARRAICFGGLWFLLLAGSEVLHHQREPRIPLLIGLVVLFTLVAGYLARFRPRLGLTALVPTVLLALAAVLRVLPAGGGERRALAGNESGDRPNVFLIVVDTARGDHFHCNGYSRPTTDFLDQLAGRAILFENAYSAAPATTPSTAAILGASFPYGDDYPENGTRPAGLALAAALSERGYRTGGFSANPFVSKTGGFDQGFDRFVSLDFLEKDFAVTHVLRASLESMGLFLPDYLRGELLNEEAIAWLGSEDPGTPVFAYLHYLDPHYPYTPSEEFRRRLAPDAERRAQRYPKEFHQGLPPWEEGSELPEAYRRSMMELYDAEIAQWDHAVQQFWQYLEKEGWLENALVVITSDHGEGFYQHRSWGHGISLLQEEIHVPLLVYRSWDRTARRVDRPVTNTGITRLVMSAVDLTTEDRAGFDPVTPLLPPGDRIVAQLSRRHGKTRGSAVVRANEKTIVLVEEDRQLVQRFDLLSDPGETSGLPVPDGEEAAPAIALVPSPLGVESVTATTKRDEDLLRSLGYVR